MEEAEGGGVVIRTLGQRSDEADREAPRRKRMSERIGVNLASIFLFKKLVPIPDKRTHSFPLQTVFLGELVRTYRLVLCGQGSSPPSKANFF